MTWWASLDLANPTNVWRYRLSSWPTDMASSSANRYRWWLVCERAKNGLNWDRPISMSQPQSVGSLQWHSILAIRHKLPIRRRWFHALNYDGIFVKSCHHWFDLDRVFARPNDVCCSVIILNKQTNILFMWLKLMNKNMVQTFRPKAPIVPNNQWTLQSLEDHDEYATKLHLV